MGFTAEIVIYHHYFVTVVYLYDILVLGHLSFIIICLQNPARQQNSPVPIYHRFLKLGAAVQLTT